MVGAGPAGAAAALGALSARPDARVLLLDRAGFPRDKACGDGIAAQVLDELAAVGVHDAVEGYPPVPRLRLQTPRGTVAVGAPARASHVVPRQVFDARLVAAAVRAGAELRRHRVRSLVDRGNRVVVDGVSATAVVGADGAAGVVRRLAGVPAPRDRDTAVALRGYAALGAGRSDELLIRLAEQDYPAYAWSFPIGDGRANVGYGLFADSLRRRGGGRRLLEQRLGEVLPELAPEPGTLLGQRLPLIGPGTAYGAGRVLLAGDAASLVNPLSGEGIFYAVASGRRAGAAAVGAATPLPAYTAAVRSLLRRHLAHVRIAARLALRRRLVEAVVAEASRPESFRVLSDLALADGTLTAPFLLRTARRLAGR